MRNPIPQTTSCFRQGLEAKVRWDAESSSESEQAFTGPSRRMRRDEGKQSEVFEELSSRQSAKGMMNR